MQNIAWQKSTGAKRWTTTKINIKCQQIWKLFTIDQIAVFCDQRLNCHWYWHHYLLSLLSYGILLQFCAIAWWCVAIYLWLLHCTLSCTVYCNRPCLFVFVCLWVCYHDNWKLHESISTKLGLLVKAVTISSWLDFGRPEQLGKGSAAGWTFFAPPYYSQRAVFASPLSAFFHLSPAVIGWNACTQPGVWNHIHQESC